MTTLATSRLAGMALVALVTLGAVLANRDARRGLAAVLADAGRALFRGDR